MLLILSTSCGSKDDECTKMMAIPHYTVVNNQFQRYDVMEEVPCDFPEPEELQEAPQLKNFSYEVLYFTFIPDTGNNTSQLKFEIKLNNGNNYAAEGMPFLTIRSEEMVYTRSFSNEIINPCHAIAATSSCVLIFNKEYPLDPNNLEPSFMELVEVKYYVSN